MKDTETCIKTCNKLLRGELSAIETYDQALDKFGDSPGASTLSRIRGEHQDSAAALREHLTAMGAVPDSDSGPWGGFAQAVEGTAKLLGGSAAIRALMEGEKHGINEYEEALGSPGVMDEAKLTIRERLLPRLHEHIATLDGLPG